MTNIHPDELDQIPRLEGAPEWGGSRMMALHAARARETLIDTAKQKLHSTERDFVRGVGKPEFHRVGQHAIRVTIRISGVLPYLVQHGQDAYDMRRTLLKPGTKSLRTSKEGYYYLHVPFRHMSPGATGRNAPRVGSQYTSDEQGPQSRSFRGGESADDARKMGRAAHRRAKKLGDTSQSQPGKTDWGGKLEEGAGGAYRLRSRHATDLYAGMVKKTYTYPSGRKGSSYLTFRTISNNPESFRSDEDGGSPERNWTHPGIEARHIVEDTQAHLIRRLEEDGGLP